MNFETIPDLLFHFQITQIIPLCFPLTQLTATKQLILRPSLMSSFTFRQNRCTHCVFVFLDVRQPAYPTEFHVIQDSSDEYRGRLQLALFSQTWWVNRCSFKLPTLHLQLLKCWLIPFTVSLFISLSVCVSNNTRWSGLHEKKYGR